MAVPQEIERLIERYDAQREAYESGQYKETEIRVEFIDPFFKALDWDVHNEQGYAEAYKDVIHEQALKIGGATEAPDSCFRIGGARKFFVECKKPSVNIKDAPHPAYQLRRYGWSAKLPLSILTDFGEFAVYDCRVKPCKNDSAAVGRVMYLTSGQYAEKWDEIAAIFSREAVLKGSFDKFAEGAKGKRGTASVDDAFLEEIERWRDLLARNVALRNPDLSQRELNFSVQCTIDRIIFLRICEDRGIEPYGRLMTLRNGERVYPRLCEFFQRADERYNSGLFHFQREKDRPEAPDELTLKLNLDDKVLHDILANLYYPDSPYEFSVLSADILGQVYERFLGKVIRLTAGHQAKVEEKPEVRKAGGVYYTPTYIVDYIVKNTVGKLIEEIGSGKGAKSPRRITPQDVAKLKILDPACGSGSFLLGAYQYLLDWHLDWYVNHDLARWATGKHPSVYQKTLCGLASLREEHSWHLTTEERKRILLNNIFGVDIDSQAVEVTKLSLLLKVLEGESQESITKQFELFHQRALPDLGSNIKCGNSLIGPDFYRQGQLPLMTDDEKYSINVFDWQAEFPDIFRAGGFEAVIGNPPYRMLQPHNTEASVLAYLREHYIAAEFKIELFHLFLQKGISLLRTGGYHGHIVPTTILNNVYAESLRSRLLDECAIESIAVSLHRVFATADVHTSVLVFRREADTKRRLQQVVKTSTALGPEFSRNPVYTGAITQRRLYEFSGKVWNISVTEQNAYILQRLTTKFPKLGEVAKINRGLITGDRSKFFSEERLTKNHIPILAGGDVLRYLILAPSEFVLFERPKTAGGCWDREVHLAEHKIVVRQIGTGPTATYLDRPLAVTGNIFTVRCRDSRAELFVLGILNSKLTDYFWKVMFADFKGSFPQITIFSLEQLPIRVLDLSNASDKAQHDRMVKLVEQMLELHKKLAAARTPQEQNALERQITATDQQIDRLVYDLYGLTEEEIRIVEGDN